MKRYKYIEKTRWKQSRLPETSEGVDGRIRLTWRYRMYLCRPGCFYFEVGRERLTWIGRSKHVNNSREGM